ncbi:hypothetical protein PVAR5_5009 [Paecilomyces variotii No. 5]|uniref:Uncharacterized protein n=1 Tax=Byssochlamys spectabilis (strain No. 5 / NBRC 109023) TaxID=1356009 RepID=V5G314_BYSSN|nr:hypothetical protein PVAR5_5009 [Paecilomyces variotii No. 5]
MRTPHQLPLRRNHHARGKEKGGFSNRFYSLSQQSLCAQQRQFSDLSLIPQDPKNAQRADGDGLLSLRDGIDGIVDQKSQREMKQTIEGEKGTDPTPGDNLWREGNCTGEDPEIFDLSNSICPSRSTPAADCLDDDVISARLSLRKSEQTRPCKVPVLQSAPGLKTLPQATGFTGALWRRERRLLATDVRLPALHTTLWLAVQRRGGRQITNSGNVCRDPILSTISRPYPATPVDVQSRGSSVDDGWADEETLISAPGFQNIWSDIWVSVCLLIDNSPSAATVPMYSITNDLLIINHWSQHADTLTMLYI